MMLGLGLGPALRPERCGLGLGFTPRGLGLALRGLGLGLMGLALLLASKILQGQGKDFI